ncbi:hypothetical protein LXL04_034966 [Taraxacum kok-saghyz]
MDSVSRNSLFRQSNASKIDQLYEIAYLSYELKIPISQLPIVNPYNVFNKPVTSFSKKVKKLIESTSNQQAKEYVFFSASSHLLRTFGYTHIHFGAIRLALTFHGRKGLTAFSQIALVEYQHACIGTIQTTLNAGTIFVTFYPNFNRPLNDPSFFTSLKAQIQIGGTPQVNTFQAIFHYQMAYRVQNHYLDIMVPGQANSGDALFLDVDSNATPTCTYVPRQLSKDELIKLLPDKWVTNYEQIHQAPVQSTTAPDFICHVNGQVEVNFPAQESSQNRNIFPTYDETFPIKQHKLEELYNIEDPSVRKQHQILSPYLQHALSIIHKEQESSPNLSTLSCYVISSDPSTSTYQTDFPPLTTFENPHQRTKHNWKIKKSNNPYRINGITDPTPISHAQATLNWKSENVVAQNRVLIQILLRQSLISKSDEAIFSKVKTLEDLITEVRIKLNRLHNDLLQMANDSTFTRASTVLSHKEAEMKTLKNKHVELERQHKL